MKPKYSVFALFVRHTVYPLLLLLAVLTAAEWALFARLCPDPTFFSLEEALYARRIPLLLVLAVGFLLVLFLLAEWLPFRNARQAAYTLDRLSVPPRTVFLLQAGYNTLALLLFWAAQALSLLALGWIYQRHGGTLGPQTLFLACWRNDLLHSFLPLEDVSRWVRNLLVLLGLGVTSAWAAGLRRQKKISVAFVILTCAVALFFVRPLGDTSIDVLLSLCAVICPAAAIAVHHTGGEANPDAQTNP